MIILRKSNKDELKVFVEMENQAHAKSFINGTDLTTHLRDIERHDICYLSITDGKNLVGYFILALDSSTKDVEFRRILIDQHHRGIGQIAISKMEAFCREQLDYKRIWLDVYAENAKGIYIYEKLGYQQFKQGTYNNRKLFYYEKSL